MRKRGVVAGLAGLVALTGVAALAPAAEGAHHFVRINEVYPGETGSEGSEFVELQLTAPGENQLFNQTEVRLYDSAGAQTNSVAFPALPPANGLNQRFVLAATAAAAASPDATLPPVDAISRLGGGACFYSNAGFMGVDCVTWGNYSGPALPSPTGIPAHPSGAVGDPLDDGDSLIRNISAGCSTLHQPSDDTNNSHTDFDLDVNQTPRNHSFVNTGNPECVLTVNVTGTAGSVTGTGINCTAAGGDCTQTFVAGEDVLLTATPSGGSTGNGFTGDNCEPPSTPPLTCTQDMQVSQTVNYSFTGGAAPPTNPPVTPITPVTPVTPAETAKKCPKGKKLKKGKCVKKKKKK